MSLTEQMPWVKDASMENKKEESHFSRHSYHRVTTAVQLWCSAWDPNAKTAFRFPHFLLRVPGTGVTCKVFDTPEGFWPPGWAVAAVRGQGHSRGLEM
jgi:hypothetical protein